MSEPLYRRLDFVTDARLVWERLEAGWDWLGVTAEGEFVLGYPGTAGPARRARPVTIVQAGAREGQHGVRVETPFEPPTERWFARESEARDEFARVVDVLRRRPHTRPSLTLVQRIEQGAVVDELFVRV